MSVYAIPSLDKCIFLFFIPPPHCVLIGAFAGAKYPLVCPISNFCERWPLIGSFRCANQKTSVALGPFRKSAWTGWHGLQNATVGDGLNFAVNRGYGVGNRPDGGQPGFPRTLPIPRMSKSVGSGRFYPLLVGLWAKTEILKTNSNEQNILKNPKNFKKSIFFLKVQNCFWRSPMTPRVVADTLWDLQK